MTVRPLASPISRYVLLASLGGGAAIGSAVFADQLPEPDADGTSKGRIDRKEGLDMVTGLRSSFGVFTVFGAALGLSQLYGPARHALPAGELAFCKGLYALAGGAMVGALLTGGLFDTSGDYETRHVPRTDR